MLSSFSDSIFTEVNLAEMHDVNVKLVLLGDGMSGKTQILIKFGKIITNHLKQLYWLHSKNPEGVNERKEFNVDFSKTKFIRWAKQNEFQVEYGNHLWDLSSISLDIETVGLEDFCIAFPYVFENLTYRIKLYGNDLGGQNIFDHLRAVLGKIMTPDDNLLVVFDKSRRLSCYNSIQQIKEVTGEKISDKLYLNKNLPRLWFIGNKSDLETHIKAKNWCELISKNLSNKLQTATSHSLPSLIDFEKGEILISYEIKNNKVTFPDLEALVYNSIRESDEKYGSNLMSEVNTKSLAREITAQLFHIQRFNKSNDEISDQKSYDLTEFNNLIFKQRPLALQYARPIGILQENKISDISYDRVRKTWKEYNFNYPVNQKSVEKAIKQAGETNQVLSSMGTYFSTNAVKGDGIRELFDAVIQFNLQEIRNIKLKSSKKFEKRRISRF